MSYWRQKKFFKFKNLQIRHQACHKLGKHVKSPLRCGFQICEDGHANVNFVTPQYALVYILSGEGYYEDEQNGCIKVKPGCFVQRFPNVVHQLYLEDYGASFFVAMPAEALKVFQITDALASESPVIDLGVYSKIIQDYLTIIEEMKQEKEELMALMLKMQQMILGIHQFIRKKKQHVSDDIYEIIAFLNTNYTEKVNLPELASRMNISYNSLRKQFKSATGMALGDYRILKKIEKARELLFEGLSVKETAAELNYPDAYVFSRQFKKIVGVAPTTFTKMHL